MPRIPVEVISQIIWDLQPRGGQHLAPLATINRHWQGAVEAILGRQIRITKADIDAFTTFFHTDARRRAVRHIIFDAEYFKKPAKDGRDEEENKDHGDEDSNEELGHDRDTTGGVVQEHYEHVGTKTGHDEMDSTYRDAQQSLSIFRNEHFRFFHDIRKIWDTVASCAEVKSIQIIVDGCPMYEKLGPAFRDHDVIDACLRAENWLGQCPPLPVLPTVEAFVMRPRVNTDVDLWTAIAGCAVARSLPALKQLEIRGDDRDRRWEGVKRECREVLSRQLMNLPSSLEVVEIWLPHTGINDQRFQPTNFLMGGVDNFSRAIHHLSTHLTKLFLFVNHISPTLFWPENNSDPSSSSSSSSTPHWPNLTTLDIRTGFEAAAGVYWMRNASDYPSSTFGLDYHWTYDAPEDSDSDFNDDAAPGSWPVLYFRIRPDPPLFDTLATSIARAISHMPQLVYLNLEFNAVHRGPKSGSYEHFAKYQGWACYFRASNTARFASTCFEDEWPQPGPDFTEIERPRLEWVFQCPFREVQWRQPDEAEVLWRARFPDMDSDLVTLDYGEDDEGYKTWERRREGVVVCRSRCVY